MKGFTLLEMGIVLTILVILTAVGVGAYQAFISEQYLKSAAQIFYQDLQRAQSLATSDQQTILVNVQTGNSWCYGLTDTGSACDCTQTNCTIGGQLKVVNASAYNNLSLSANGQFVTNTQLYFDGIRGTIALSAAVSNSTPPISNSSFQFQSSTNTNLKMGVTLNDLGQLKLCSINVPGFTTCP